MQNQITDSLEKITSWIPQVNSAASSSGELIQLYSIFERQNGFFGLPVENVVEVMPGSGRKGDGRNILLSDGKTGVALLFIDQLLGLPAQNEAEPGLILVLQYLAQSPVAILVDRIHGVLTVAEKEINFLLPPPAPFITGHWDSPELHEKVTLLSLPELLPLLTGELPDLPGAEIEGGN